MRHERDDDTGDLNELAARIVDEATDGNESGTI